MITKINDMWIPANDPIQHMTGEILSEEIKNRAKTQYLEEEKIYNSLINANIHYNLGMQDVGIAGQAGLENLLYNINYQNYEFGLYQEDGTQFGLMQSAYDRAMQHNRLYNRCRASQKILPE